MQIGKRSLEAWAAAVFCDRVSIHWASLSPGVRGHPLMAETHTTFPSPLNCKTYDHDCIELTNSTGGTPGTPADCPQECASLQA